MREILRRLGRRLQGPARPRGETGPAGPLLDKLPSGKTLRGAFAASGKAAAAGETVRDAPSFALQVTPDWIPNVIPAGGPPTPQCPGDVNAPEAAAGQLCAYQGANVNAILATDSPAGVGAERFGWIAQVTSTSAGDYQS